MNIIENDISMYYKSLTDNNREIEYGKDNLLKSIKKNLNRWGTDANHNILYIMGISGSGKSTIANLLSNDNTIVIHLDAYFELKNKNLRQLYNKELNVFLNKNEFDYSQLGNETLFRTNKGLYFKYIDEFAKLTEKFGAIQYSKRKRVIIEGVYLNGDNFYSDTSFFDDKPLIITTTDPELSLERAAIRDKQH